MPWEEYFAHPPSAPLPQFLSVRGKNLYFLDRLAAALQLDKIPQSATLVDFKRAFTPTAVRQVFEAVIDTWVDEPDLIRALEGERRWTSGLYSGWYDPDGIERGITRHSLYADSILLIDPFPDPRTIREEFNPLVHPEEHRSLALRWATLWFHLSEWIEAGLVKFVRTPGDFNAQAYHESIKSARARFEHDSQLKALLAEETAAAKDSRFVASYRDQLRLAIPDELARDWYRKQCPDASDEELDTFIGYIQRKRDAHPYFVEPIGIKGGSGELLHLTVGASYDIAKETAVLTGSHFLTDRPTRWREIEMDRELARIDARRWTAFAKAFQGLTFDFLENVPLEAALSLRKEHRLESMRDFLRKVWKTSKTEQEFSEQNVEELAAELRDHLREAEIEWKKIDRDLLRWTGSEFVASALALPTIAHGHAEWLGAAVITAGVTNLVVSGMKRAEHEKRYPAGFFLKLRDQQE